MYDVVWLSDLMEKNMYVQGVAMVMTGGWGPSVIKNQICTMNDKRAMKKKKNYAYLLRCWHKNENRFQKEAWWRSGFDILISFTIFLSICKDVYDPKLFNKKPLETGIYAFMLIMMWLVIMVKVKVSLKSKACLHRFKEGVQSFLLSPFSLI